MDIHDSSWYHIASCSIQVELSGITSHAGPKLDVLVQRGQELVEKLFIIKVDPKEFACIKFLILFNPG